MNPDIGKALIGCIVAHFDEVWPSVEAVGVKREWFEKREDRMAFEAIEMAVACDGACDAMSVLVASEKLHGANALSVRYFEEAIDLPTSLMAAATYAADLRDSWQRREFTLKLAAAKKAAEDGSANFGEIVAELVSQAEDLADAGLAEREIDKGKALDEKNALWKEVRRQRFELNNPTYCIGTPLPWGCLNSVFNGLRPGLHILGARTSVGKTVFAINCSQFWMERGIHHVFVTLDMNERELLSRYVSSMGLVSLRKLEWGASSEELAAADSVIARVRENPYLHAIGIEDVDSLSAWLRMAVRRWGVKACIIDYVQLLRCRGDRQMRSFDRVCECVQRLKRTANDLKLPFLLLAQLSRNIDNAQRENIYAEPTLADLGDSSEIEKAAASVTLMYREPTVEQVWRDDPPLGLAYGEARVAEHLRAIWFKVAKNQQGLAGLRRPFIMYPAQFILRPSNYENRTPNIFLENEGTRREKQIIDWTPSFGQIRDDWRTLPTDSALGPHLGDRVYHDGE